ncbi:sensor histidine kinase [Streptomyces sp. NPDC057910]|uniref:sensor histidine kinase n=1 Tax=Streptomyces sp. NPDC057910 TaxID=3346278 RepID=UPI0036F1843D
MNQLKSSLDTDSAETPRSPVASVVIRVTRRSLARVSSVVRPRPQEPSFANGRDAVDDLLGRYQLRALQRQAALRFGFVFAAIAEFLLFPPRVHTHATEVILVLYTAYAVAMLALAWQKETLRHVALAVPVVDLPALALFLVVPGYYHDPEWNNPFTSDWLLMIVIMSAFQLRPIVTAVTGVFATAFYGTVSAVGHLHDSRGLHYTIGHTLSVALVSLASVLLSRIQQERVRHIADLAHGRASMLATTLSIIERDRRYLAESLHDGPLQSVLAARLDVGEVAEIRSHEALTRADEALRDAARQLRSSVTELHPSVLDRSGLEQALDDLASRAGQRGKFTTQVICTAPSAGADIDRLFYNCAREFLTNVVKHAQAENVVVRFELDGEVARLSVTDDGIGLPTTILEERAAQGHIGIASQQLRLQEVGGTLTISPNNPTGTVVEAFLPVREQAKNSQSSATNEKTV